MSGTRHWKPFDPSVATALEALAAIAPPEPVRSLRQGTKANALRRARTCYHHLSGRLGVALMAALLDRGLIVKGTDGDPAGSGSLTAPGQHITYSITNAGRRELSDFGLDLIEAERHHPSIHPSDIAWTDPSNATTSPGLWARPSPATYSTSTGSGTRPLLARSPSPTPARTACAPSSGSPRLTRQPRADRSPSGPGLRV